MPGKIRSNSNGQFDISDIVTIINQVALEQKEMNGAVSEGNRESAILEIFWGVDGLFIE